MAILALVVDEFKIGLSYPWLMTAITREGHPKGFMAGVIFFVGLSLTLALLAAHLYLGSSGKS